jgi:hypothetical protein
VCVCTCVCAYTHTHVHTVCTYRGMCACECAYWFTCTHPDTHPCVCMCACAPCPPQHDSPLTPPLQQNEATPLYASAYQGHTNIVLALLQAGAAVDAKDKVRGDLRSLMLRSLALLLSLSSLALFLGFIWACRG